MKTGRTLSELAIELQRQAESRKDYIAPQGAVDAVVDNGEVKLAGFNGGAMAITPYAHGQLSDVLEIPKRYYDRMATEQPELLAHNIRTWLKADPDNKRMIRTLDSKVRAVLSPKYRPLDNFDLANAILPVLLDRKIDILSCELTETRMYIKGILPDLSDELPVGLAWGTGHNAVGTGVDRGRVVSAIVISNSDVGNGTLRVEPSVFTTWCTNLAIMKDAAMRKYHVGRAHQADGDWQVFRDETREADDRAFWLKVGDVTRAAFDPKFFRAAIERIKATAVQPIVSDDLPKVVERTVEMLALPPASNAGILKHLAAGGDLTQWGLSSAVTRVANEQENYETATALERAGGELLAMATPSWLKLAGKEAA